MINRDNGCVCAVAFVFFMNRDCTVQVFELTHGVFARTAFVQVSVLFDVLFRVGTLCVDVWTVRLILQNSIYSKHLLDAVFSLRS